MQFKEFEPIEFANIRKSLISKKGSDFQREFLEAAKTIETFIDWITTYIPYNDEKVKDIALYPQKLTENEFKETPREVEKLAYKTWDKLTPSIACRSSFWGAVTLNHLKHDIIESTYLAVGPGSSQTGFSRIEEALTTDNAKMMDDVVRTILRRFSGLPEARGGLRSIYVNCSFGRAWWRERVTEEVVKFTKGDENNISLTLRRSQEYWEKLVNILSTSNAVFGDENIRTSFIWALSEHVEDPKYSRLFKSSGDIDRCMTTLGVYSALQEFGVFELSELKKFMQDEVIEPVLLA